MITEKELLQNGFRKEEESSNWTYYSKAGFTIVEHYGEYYVDPEFLSEVGLEPLSEDDDQIVVNTIEELNELFNKYALARINVLEQLIMISECEIMKLKILINP